MSYLRDTVIILKNEPFREQDSWVTMYGRQFGKLQAVARGARRASAKSLGHLEPLSEVEVMIAKGVSFDKLAVAHAIHPRVVLREELGMIALACGFADLVDVLTKPGLEDRAIFDLCIELFSLSQSETFSLARFQLLFAGATLRLLDLLGYAPAVSEIEISEDGRRMLHFMRRRPLSELLKITAPASLFFEISRVMDDCVKLAPWYKQPHGSRTLASILS